MGALLKQLDFREKIDRAAGVLICTPEYVFSLPAILKNALEWTVSTVIFTDKPLALITASTAGEKAHESLLLIMKTLQAKLIDKANLHISGARSRLNSEGHISDQETIQNLENLIKTFLVGIKN